MPLRACDARGGGERLFLNHHLVWTGTRTGGTEEEARGGGDTLTDIEYAVKERIPMESLRGARV